MSEAELKSYQLNINGNLFSVASPRGESHIREVEAFLGEKVAEIHRHLENSAPTNNLSMLVALNLADELIDLKKEQSSVARVEKNLRSLCQQLDEVLDEDSSPS